MKGKRGEKKKALLENQLSKQVLLQVTETVCSSSNENNTLLDFNKKSYKMRQHVK